MAVKDFHYDAQKVAYYEVEGWKAYYDRDWLRLLSLVVSLAQAQFHIPFPQSWVAAYYITRASVAFVPKEHDQVLVRGYLEKFYRLSQRYSGLNFDPAKAADLENEYWEVHRRLSGKPDKTEFIETMAQLHAAVFGLTLDQARESGQLRVEANNVLDTITGHTSTDVARDWLRCADLLNQCYGSIERVSA